MLENPNENLPCSGREEPAQSSKICSWLPLILLAACAFLIFTGLGRVAFWDDEAHVALFGRSLLKTHTQSAWDGRNLIPDHDGAGWDENLLNMMPQLDNFLPAISFAIFGESNWSARLPFALCGLAAMLVFWRLLLLEFPTEPQLRLYALASACLSVPLILYFRNCRYYGLSVLLTMGILLFYRKFLETRQWRYAWLIGVLGGLLSLSSILNCACLAGALAFRHLAFHLRDLGAKDWLKVALAGMVAGGVATIYGMAYMVPTMERGRQYAAIMHLPPNPALPIYWTAMMWRNLHGLSLAHALPWTVGLGLLAFLLWRHPKEVAPARRRVLEMLGFAAGFLVVLSALSPQPLDRTSISDVRYFTPMLPVIAILVGAVFWWIHRKSPLVATVVLALYLGCNWMSHPFEGESFRLLLPDYLREIFNAYPTSASETCAFLRENAKQDDTVWIYPDWYGKPLQWYVGDKIKLRGVLDRQTLIPQKGLAQLPPDIFIDQLFPNWVISFGRNEEVQSTVSAFSRRLPGTDAGYRYQCVKVLDVYWRQNQRPELYWHSFGPWRRFDKATESIYIFKRSDSPVKLPTAQKKGPQPT